MSLKLDLTVAAIAEDSGRFLFVQERAARRVVLNQPAGHVESGESLVDAVIRETREETGREFRPESVTGLYLWQGPSGRTVLRVAFAGPWASASPARQLDRAILGHALAGPRRTRRAHRRAPQPARPALRRRLPARGALSARDARSRCRSAPPSPQGGGLTPMAHVVVALSGGVDSPVAAALLLEAGTSRRGPLHVELGRGRRRLLHVRRGLPGCAPRLRRARHPAAQGQLRARVP